ncbi:cell division protein SepF [Sporosalibacterium faouarense]|uniref:cell division protein SepF n=1 Tax=Sporosalibacterium faouarense TaxID=516123 RepID=UPI00141C62F6|nr:cell division protein SepF [Sporosalibacterium faouarense]MTI47757.1 cell division protein SepF [Bacillota bacterium]
MGKNANKILDKFKYLIGLDDLEEDYYEEEEESTEIEDITPKKYNRNNKIVNIHTNSNVKLSVHEPKRFEDVIKIIDDIKARKPVVINLTKLESELKRRVFDFLNGGLYSLEGNIQKVTKDIFILAPKSVEIDGNNIREELKNKGIFPWQK